MPRVFRQIATTALVATSLFALAACSRGSGGGGKDVAATVNGKEIMLSEVDRLVNQQATAQGAQLSPIEQAAARLTVLDKLIEREAVVQKADKEKVTPTDEEINTAINSQRSQMTAEEWQKFLQENKLTEDQIREEARKDIAVKKLQDKLFGKITIREQEIADFYNNNREQYVNPRGVWLSDIVVDPRDNTMDNNRVGGAPEDDAKSDAEAKAKIDRLYATLKGGADFATIARSSSEDASAARSGDIGVANEEVLHQYNFPPELISRFFGPMQVGSFTEPVHLPDGRWYIFKLTNRRLETKPRTLDDAHEEIKNALISQRQQILQEALIRNSMSDATVVNNLAADILNDPNMLGGNQPVSPGAVPSPAASATQSATPATTPAATATAPAAAAPAATTAKPTPAAKPTAAATPKPQATHAAPTTPGPSPKR